MTVQYNFFVSNLCIYLVPDITYGKVYSISDEAAKILMLQDS